jgi:hypothetical protein
MSKGPWLKRQRIHRVLSDGSIAIFLANKNMEAIIDASDFQTVNAYCWRAIRRHSNLWYAEATLPGPTKPKILMHRLILGLGPGIRYRGGVIYDHEDGDGLNNRRQNLRPATTQQNVRNGRKTTTQTSSLYKGVRLMGKCWVAEIRRAGKRYIGSFATQEEAARAYDKAAAEAFGEYARLNFPIAPASAVRFAAPMHVQVHP